MVGEDDDGVSAITAIMNALKPLDSKTRIDVLTFVTRRLEMDFKLPGKQGDENDGETEIKEKARRKSQDIVDLRSLADEKNPKTVNEKVAVVAFYLKHYAPDDEKRDYIQSEDISKYFVQAGFELPTAPPNMTLTNAKNAGYLNQLERGQYRLNPVGYNLVAHKLPAGEAQPRKTTRRVKKSAKNKRR